MLKLSPIGWALRPFKRYAQLSGRASRAEFWWYTLFLMIIYFALVILVMGSVASLATTNPASTGLGGGMVFIVLFWLALFIPTLAVQFRRLHDTDRSGWWLGGFWLVYVLYMVVLMAAAGAGSTSGIAGAGIMLVLALAMFGYSILLLVFFCLAGTRGPNRFGEDPYGADIEEVFA